MLNLIALVMGALEDNDEEIVLGSQPVSICPALDGRDFSLSRDCMSKIRLAPNLM